jgi:hypothetical protein
MGTAISDQGQIRCQVRIDANNVDCAVPRALCRGARKLSQDCACEEQEKQEAERHDDIRWVHENGL